MNAIANWEEVPLFDREEAEAAFWADNRLDVRLMERAVVASGEMADSITITLRMDPRMLTRIKRLARSRFLNYQSMIKQWLSERMEQELREQRAVSRSEGGFTLIELLAVIAIIGIIAAMVLGLGSLASRKKHDAVASAVIGKLTLMIENYHSKLGYYPPDNITNSQVSNWPAYDVSTAQNQLVYELSGATEVVNPDSSISFQTPYLIAIGSGGTTVIQSNLLVPAGAFENAFGRGGVANSSPDEPHSFFKPLPKPGELATNALWMPVTGGSLNFGGLIVPLPRLGNTNGPNYVHYDSSSAYRHNSTSFDVWVEYDGGSSGTNIIGITNGNW